MYPTEDETRKEAARREKLQRVEKYFRDEFDWYLEENEDGKYSIMNAEGELMTPKLFNTTQGAKKFVQNAKRQAEECFYERYCEEYDKIFADILEAG